MDAVFKDAGSCGCFQVCHILCIQLIRFISVWASYLMVFGNYEPPWKCIKRSMLTNTTWHNQNVSSFSKMNSDEDCTFCDIKTNTSYLNAILNVTRDNNTGLYIQGTCDQLPFCDQIVFDPTSVTLVSEFGLICDQSFVPSIILAVQMTGMLVGANIGGQMGESFGRKLCIYSSMALTSLTTLSAAWSNTWQMYAGLTFFIGLGVGGIEAALTVYAAEFLTPRWRGRFGAIPMWNISLLIFAFVIIGLKVWWQIHIFCGAAATIFLMCALWTPESLRWLYIHGKDAEVGVVLKKIMKCNQRREGLPEALKKLNAVGQKDEKKTKRRRYTYLDLFRRSDVRSRTVKVSIGWFSILMCYYTLGFSVKALAGDYYTNLLLSCVSEIPFVLLMGPCVNMLGRRFTTSLFMTLATMLTVACVITHYCISHELGETVIKYLAILAKGCANVAWGAIVLYSTELFPTAIRNLAMGVFNTVARIGGIVATMIIPQGKETSVITFFVLSGALIMASIIILTLPETKNKPLTDEITVEVKTTVEVKIMEKPEPDVSEV